MKQARQLVVVGLGLSLMGMGCAGQADIGLDKMVDQAIREFEPDWQPQQGEIGRLVVLIVPMARQAGHPADADRFSLLTASYFYHMVREGSGIPAMYRSDADLLPSPDNLDRADLARTASAAKCDLCIILDPPEKEKGSEAAFRAIVRAASSEPLSQPFAETVANSLDFAVGPVEIIAELHAPAIRIQMPDAAIAKHGFAPPPHRLMAERLYRAVAAFAAGRRESLAASRLTRWPQSAPSAVDLGAVRPVSPEAERIMTVVRTIRPSGDLYLEQAAWFCDMFRRINLTDATTVYFNPQISIEEGGVVLRGATTAPALARTLERALKMAGIEQVRNEMRCLPEDGRLDGQRFATLTVSTARTYSRPSDLSNVQTQLLYGELLWLLDHRDGWYLVHASDGYWGWVRQEAVRIIEPLQFESSLNSKQAAVLTAIEIGGTRVPAGARLPLVGQTPWNISVRTPSGEVAAVACGSVRVIDDFATTRPRIMPALEMLYIPYVFGARSPLGLDCSGMVNNLFDRSGLPVARDATQQFLSGKLVATRWYRAAIRPGDRLYFLDNYGKIFHTGIAISSTHFIHSSPPAVQISNLQKGDRLYEQYWDQCFLGAKRP
ncbi:MAG: C40 family peptidase [Phycisphaerae bacterium]